MRLAILAVGLGLGTVAGCFQASVFECADSQQCVFEGVQGTCEATGYCSFPDDDCESGWSYGEHAGAGLEGECVPVEGDSGGTSGDAGSGDDGSGDDGTSDDDGATGSDDGGTSGTGDDTTTGTPDDCGNGTIDPGEDCDGDELGSATCASVGAGNEGELACTDDCEFDTSDCVDTCGLDRFEWGFLSCPENWTHGPISGAWNDSWECGTPVTGPGNDPDHEGVWATDLAGSYYSSESSALISPAITLANCPGENLWLVFEHWYEFDDMFASDRDGGIVQVSTNGINWDTVEPVRNGYGSQTLNTVYTPPDGEVGYTGDSDWLISAASLSDYGGEPDLLVRFVFGSGTNYTDDGWFIDWVALSKCGDGNITADEQCEGMDLQGESCASLGLDAGTLACDPSTCFFDTSGCTPTEITECSTPGVPIPDLGDVFDIITVPYMGAVTDVNVLVQVSHGYTEDLDIRVQHLTTGQWLVRDECGTANDVDAVFDDEGSPLSCATDPAIAGDVTPEEPLDAYDGLEAQGDWRLQVYDDEAVGTGTLEHWCVTITF
jgi:subtilisin-like proprotein convertase family protein